MTMEVRKVSTGDFKVGDQLPWNVIDNKGNLLLKKGAVVTSERLHQILVDKGVYQPESATGTAPTEKKTLESYKGPFNPFEIIETCTFRLGRVLYNLTQGKECSEAIDVIASDIMLACEKAPDAALGAVHLLHGHAYTTIHPIHVAALCYALCTAQKMSKEETHTIIAACLTSNIGMLELQETLHEQTTPLTDEQKKQIQIHPIQSAKILKAANITDPMWLKIVLQHHERTNGQGYPQGLKEEEIVKGARILALADCYSAMISPRDYKESMGASNALKQIFLDRGKEYDETLSVLLIKYMGVYPPGAYVMLNNGEIAVVVKRTSNNMAPKVASVFSASGTPYTRPIPRETTRDEFSIKGIVDTDEKRLAFNIANIWGYQPS